MIRRTVPHFDPRIFAWVLDCPDCPAYAMWAAEAFPHNPGTHWHRCQASQEKEKR